MAGDGFDIERYLREGKGFIEKALEQYLKKDQRIRSALDQAVCTAS